MSKYYGTIGFIKQIEDPPESGIWKEKTIERKYYGDILQHSVSYREGEGSNDNLYISNELSLIADSFIIDNAYCINYVEMLGGRWMVRNISFSYPRIILSIGGVYNGRSGPKIDPPSEI